MRRASSATRLAAGLVLAAVLGLTAARGDTRFVRSDATLEVNMRELWDAQATWTRLYLVSALGNLPDSGFDCNPGILQSNSQASGQVSSPLRSKPAL